MGRKFTASDHEYSRQSSVKILSEQNTNDWFAKKKRYDIDLLGISNERVGNHGKQ